MVMLRQPSGCAIAAILLATLPPTLARAQATSQQLGEITVTADRVDEPVNSTGSSVTVIPGSRVQQWGANGITEVLRDAVGVTVTQNGGPDGRGNDDAGALPSLALNLSRPPRSACG